MIHKNNDQMTSNEAEVNEHYLVWQKWHHKNTTAILIKFLRFHILMLPVKMWTLNRKDREKWNISKTSAEI